MKPQKTHVVVDQSTPGGRIAWLLQKIWRGSQSRMAADTGVSQSAVSNVATGRRAPGRKILATVSAHPLVNATWLLTGEGEPLVREEQPGHPGGHFCPVADCLLPGPPRDCRDQLTGQYRPVTAPDYTEYRYWLQIDTEDLVGQGLHRGDWLLLDTDGSWLQRPKVLVGQPCVVRTVDRAKPTLAIRLLRYDPEVTPVGKYAVDLLAATPQEPKLEPEERKTRNIRIRSRTKRSMAKSKKAVSPSNAAANLVLLTMIAAVAVKSERQWP